jgi:phosphotransferase system IIB component
MKLFYKVQPDEYTNCMTRIREKFAMHEEIDEARTTLVLEDQSKIERVSGTFDPSSDDAAQIRVVLNDESLKEFFDSILGEPYLVK